jgi:hypothetical protein
MSEIDQLKEKIKNLEACLRHLAKGPKFHPEGCCICTLAKNIIDNTGTWSELPS